MAPPKLATQGSLGLFCRRVLGNHRLNATFNDSCGDGEAREAGNIMDIQLLH